MWQGDLKKQKLLSEITLRLYDTEQTLIVNFRKTNYESLIP